MIHTAARTRVLNLVDGSLPAINQIVAELMSELLSRDEISLQDVQYILRAELRYKGQENTLPITIPLDGDKIGWDCDQIRVAFESDYEKVNSGTLHEPVELVSLRISMLLPLPRRLPRSPRITAEHDLTRTCETYSFKEHGRRTFRIVPRGAINGVLSGPAIVTEKTTTLYLDAGWTASVGEYGELLLSATELKP
jgi:N-methylhydantoinase A